MQVAFTMRIPRHHRGERLPIHPASISALTKSVSIGVNGGTPKVFNATPSSGGCTSGASGTSCTFSFGAPVGADTFAVKTYSGTGGTGSVLDYGTALVNIIAGKANIAHVKVGPVVTTTADSGPGSLRYAIAYANSGDTIMFLLPANSKISLASSITPLTNLTIAGPGFKAALRPHLNPHGVRSDTTYSGITISGANTKQVFIITTGVTITLSGLVITGGKASVAHQPGGAISNEGNLTLLNDAITDNKSEVSTIVRAPHHKLHRSSPKAKHGVLARSLRLHPHSCSTTYSEGGAIYNDGLLVITGTTFDGNTTPNSFWPSGGSNCLYGYGGAIYDDYYGTIISSNSTYKNNGTYDGGAVYLYNYYASASFTNDKFINNFGCNASNGCPSSGTAPCSGAACTPCGPSSDCVSYPYGYGAAISDEYSPGVSITNCTFTGNVAGGTTQSSYGEGGALYMDSGTPNITGSTFMNNVAGGGTNGDSEGYGGAIVNYSSSMNLSNDKFIGNVASGDYEGYGGAIYSYDPLTGTGLTFTNNKAVGSGSPAETYGYGYGGAIYQDDSSETFSVTNSTFTGNVATGSYESYAGALYAYGYGTVANDTFTSNSVIATGSTAEYTYVYGGAIYNDDYLKVTGSTFTGNTALAQGPYADEAYGGAIEADSNLVTTNNTFTSNSAIQQQYADGYGYGGAMYTDSTFSSSGDTFKSNWVNAAGSDGDSWYYYGGYGGAMYVGDGGQIAHDTFTGNWVQSPTSLGGALYLDSTTTISNSTFTGNVAGHTGQLGFGGAVLSYSSDNTFSGGTFSGNSATTAGGAVLSDTGDSFYNVTITGNTVTAASYQYGGGGIYNDGPDTVVNSTISGNTVTVTGQNAGGGGIFDDDALTLTGSTVSGNKVLGSAAFSGGGGIYSISDPRITNSTISNNSSSIDGGGYEQASGNTGYLYNATLFKNTATGKGGNLYNFGGVWMYNTIFGGGTAASGKDVYNDLGATLSTGDYNIIQTAVVNTGTYSAGAHDKTADPKLLALSSNGGPTFTNADQVGSPGVSMIPWSSAAGGTCGGVSGMGADQRGFVRGTGSKCDAGAFELHGTVSAIRVHTRKPLDHSRDHHRRGRAHHKPAREPVAR